MSSANLNLMQELRQKSAHMQEFKASLTSDIKGMLQDCEWSINPRDGQNGIPLIALRLPQRVQLDNALLLQLAEQAERYYGPVDFALFSGEAMSPVRVLSRTLLDERWRWRQ